MLKISSLSALALLAALASSASAATVTWNFTSATGAPATIDSTVLSGGTVTGSGGAAAGAFAINGTSVSSGYTGSTGGNNASLVDNNRGALSTASSAYFAFSLDVAAGTDVNFSSLSFGERSTGTGPQEMTILASTDGFLTSTTLGAASVGNTSTWTLVSPAAFSLSATPGQTVSFRIYGSASAGNNSSAANWRVDDLALTYAAAPITTPEPASLAIVGIGGALLLRRRK